MPEACLQSDWLGANQHAVASQGVVIAGRAILIPTAHTRVGTLSTFWHSSPSLGSSRMGEAPGRTVSASRQLGFHTTTRPELGIARARALHPRVVTCSTRCRAAHTWILALDPESSTQAAPDCASPSPHAPFGRSEIVRNRVTTYHTILGRGELRLGFWFHEIWSMGSL